MLSKVFRIEFIVPQGVLLIESTDLVDEGKVTLNLSQFSNGVYFFVILFGDKKEVHKIIKN